MREHREQPDMHCFLAFPFSRQWRRGVAGIASLILFFAFAGCVKLERHYPEKSFYSLEATRAGASAPSPIFGDLRLSRVQVAAPYAGKPFVYQLGGLRMEEDFYNRFFSAPGELITEATARWLRASSLFEQVYAQPAPTEPPWFMEGSVSALYGDFSDTPAKAVMEIGFNLFHDAEGGNRIVLTQNYRREIPLPAKTPAALAAGWSTALTQILGDLEKDLQRSAVSPVSGNGS